MLQRLHTQEDGQALPLIILFLLVLLGMVALVLDGGNAYAQRRFMQNAADAGALSGATALLKGEYRDTVVRQTVAQYAQANGDATATMVYEDAAGTALANPTDGIVPANAVAIRVTAQRTFPTYFARLLGMPTMTASAVASAEVTPAAPRPSEVALSPLTVPTNFYEQCATKNVSCDIWSSQYASAWGINASQYKSLIDPSNGTAGGSASTNLSQWTQYGYPGEVSVNSWLPTVSGSHGNNIADALRQRITANPYGIDPDGVVFGVVDMVIWDAIQVVGSDLSIHVAQFGRFKVRMTDVSGSHTYGHFIDYIVAGHGRGDPAATAGPRIVVLSR